MKTRRVKRNQWGNWNGYEGTRRVVEFGPDDVRAGYWLETGIDDRYAGYDNSGKYRNLAYKGKLNENAPSH